MKRYLSLIICVISLCLLLCFPVQASAAECTISEDLQTLHYNGQTYTQVNTLNFTYSYAYMQIDTQLSPSQQSTFNSVKVLSNDDETLIEATFISHDGIQTIIGYLPEQLVPEYERTLEDVETPYQVEYWDTLRLTDADLRGAPVRLDQDTAYRCEEFHVLLPLKGTELNVLKGALLIDGDSYYYVDFQESNIANRQGYYSYEQGEEIAAYMITDPALCEAIAEAYALEYALGLGDGIYTVTAFLLVIIFGLLPGGVLVLSLILGSCSKERFYQKAWRIVAALSGAALAVFIIVTLILLLA